MRAIVINNSYSSDLNLLLPQEITVVGNKGYLFLSLSYLERGLAFQVLKPQKAITSQDPIVNKCSCM